MLMNCGCRFSRSLVVAAAILATVSVPQATAQIKKFGKPKMPKIEVELLSSVEAIQPGRPFDLAVKFEIEEGWHIYWKNSGDSGKPTKVRWTLPEGFDVSPLRYPVPQREVSPGQIVTNIHEGEPIFSVTVSPPSDLKLGGKVRIKAEMDGLLCKDLCIQLPPGIRSREITLGVIDSAASPKPANSKVFEAAQYAFAKPISAVKHLEMKPVVNVDKVRPKDQFKFALVLDINKGLHIQSNKPLDEFLIATDLFLEPTAGVDFGPAQYPEHKVRTVRGKMKVAEFNGRVVIVHQAQADNTLPPGPLRIAGVLRYQACKESGQCFPPQNIEWELTVPTGAEGAKTQEINGQYFAVSNVGGGHENERSAGVATASAEDPQDAGGSSGGLQAFLERFGTVGLLFGCFLYGLVLNVTPCVFPLLSIKVLGFVQQAHESRRRTLVLGLSFGVGVTLFFVVLGFIAASGKNVLQYPAVVIALGAVVMALSLSMLGVYTLNTPQTATKLEASIQKEGVLSSFGKGALAPVLGFACTGPLLAGAFSWATQQPPATAVLAFLSAGLGMAFPYMLLGANPNWLSFLPKPGQWMITFERIMGFLLLGMVLWLMHPLVTQIGATGLEWTLGFFVAIAMACWVLGKVDFSMAAAQRWRYRGLALMIIIGSGSFVYGWMYPLDKAVAKQKAIMLAGTAGLKDWTFGIPWRRWSAEAVEETVASGKAVFVDFTSAFCTTCKINKGIAIDTKEVRDLMRECGAVPFQGDFTFEDPKILAVLKHHGQTAVPLNLLYRPGQPNSPIVLDTQLTKQYLLKKLDEVCPAKSGANGELAGFETVADQR